MKPRLPTILLIEKDEITLELYQRELNRSFKVIAVTELDGVMEMLASQDIQVVIIEPEICGGQGWDLIDLIHKALPSRPIPVIVCSTRDEGPQLNGMAVARYLTKPVLPRTLRDEIVEVLKKY